MILLKLSNHSERASYSLQLRRVKTVIKGCCIAYKEIAAMHAARKNGLLSFLFSILTRLYLLSGVAFMIVVLGNILGYLSAASYTHQALGAMIVTGVIWFLALLTSSIMSAQRSQRSELALFSGPPPGTTSSTPDSKSH